VQHAGHTDPCPEAFGILYITAAPNGSDIGVRVVEEVKCPMNNDALERIRLGQTDGPAVLRVLKGQHRPPATG
jgi:hypothetical protein